MLLLFSVKLIKFSCPTKGRMLLEFSAVSSNKFNVFKLLKYYYSIGEKKDGFEKVLESILEDRMSSLNHSTSTISSLINAWEMSVRQACSAVA